MDKFLWQIRGRHEFCRGCGKKLERKETAHRFNRETGEPTIILVEFSCPKFSGYNEFEGNTHDVYIWKEECKELEEQET